MATMKVEVVNNASFDLAGNLPKLEAGEWTSPIPFPIKPGKTAKGEARGLLCAPKDGIKGKMTVSRVFPPIEPIEQSVTVHFHVGTGSEFNQFAPDQDAGLANEHKFEPKTGNTMNANLTILEYPLNK